jgi:hypothetical protein
MSSYPRALPLLAALLLGLCSAFLVACGTGTKRGVPPANAQQLRSDLTALASAVNAGQCAKAQAAVAKVKGDILQLPSSVNQRLRDRLAKGADNLATRAPAECAQNAQTSPSETTPTDTTPTTTDTTPTDTTPTTTDTTPTTSTPGSSGGSGGASSGRGSGSGSGSGSGGTGGTGVGG